MDFFWPAPAQAAADLAGGQGSTLVFWVLGAIFTALLAALNLLALAGRSDLQEIKRELKEGSRRFRQLESSLANHSERLSLIERTCEIQHGPLPRRTTDPPGFDGRKDRCHGGERQQG
ncbi:MAG: hypothetical protein AB1578_12035 [Thermodesulfobacteriota bacterium]